jgi:MYXO-CTERM domain-containing protein
VPALLTVLAQETTTTEVRRVVGDPLPEWVVIGAGLALLAVILLAGFLVRRRSRVSAAS